MMLEEVLVSGISSKAKLDAAIDRVRRQYSGDVAFSAKNLETGEEISIDADAIFPTASTIKLTILATVFTQLRRGDLSLQERIELQDSDIVGGSGVLKELGPHVQPTVHDLSTLMIIVSDNTATNMLIDRLGGTEAINRTMQTYGLDKTVLHNRVDFDLIGNDVRRFAEAPAVELMRFNELLLRREMVDAEASEAMMSIMRKQQYLDQVPRYVNYRHSSAKILDPNELIDLGCKTGFFPGTRVDAGFMVLDSKVRIAYCAMAHGSRDGSIAPESEPGIVNGLLGRLMVEYWWPSEWKESDLTLPSAYFDRLQLPD
jgi:beta-lactamase class A